MHFQKFLLPSAIFLASLGLPACEDDTDVNRQGILGNWQLVKGFRNKKETESLSGATFSFQDNGKMETNLPIGIESPADFEIDKNTILQKGRQTVRYTIKERSDSTLTLVLEMRGMEFEMWLRRFVPAADSLESGGTEN